MRVKDLAQSYPTSRTWRVTTANAACICLVSIRATVSFDAITDTAGAHSYFFVVP